MSGPCQQRKSSADSLCATLMSLKGVICAAGQKLLAIRRRQKSAVSEIVERAPNLNISKASLCCVPLVKGIPWGFFPEFIPLQEPPCCQLQRGLCLKRATRRRRNITAAGGSSPCREGIMKTHYIIALSLQVEALRLDPRNARSGFNHQERLRENQPA